MAADVQSKSAIMVLILHSVPRAIQLSSSFWLIGILLFVKFGINSRTKNISQINLIPGGDGRLENLFLSYIKQRDNR